MFLLCKQTMSKSLFAKASRLVQIYRMRRAGRVRVVGNRNASLKMTNVPSKNHFLTPSVSWAGITITYDPDLPARRISVDLNNLTLQTGLWTSFVLQSKTFFKPITENIIFVAQETTQKHKDYDEQLVETF